MIEKTATSISKLEDVKNPNALLKDPHSTAWMELYASVWPLRESLIPTKTLKQDPH